MPGGITFFPRSNPFPGQIFNDYNHTDVYEGVDIDHRAYVSGFCMNGVKIFYNYLHLLSPATGCESRKLFESPPWPTHHS